MTSSSPKRRRRVQLNRSLSCTVRPGMLLAIAPGAQMSLQAACLLWMGWLDHLTGCLRPSGRPGIRVGSAT